jgi:type II secretory ATPase GspE/PulE/Tfp pilus assembly ATPase PilB-like protein
MAEVLRIGDMLKSKGLLNDKQLNIAIIQQKITGHILGDILVKNGFVSAKELSRAISEQAGIDFVDLDNWVIDEAALKMVPKETAEKAGFIPLELINGVLSIGIVNPSNIVAVDTVTRITSKHPKIYMVDSESFNDQMNKAYYFVEHPVAQLIETTIHAIKETTGPIPGQTLADITDLIIMDGIRRKTTDVHISPEVEGLNVFYRIDGVLQFGHFIPKVVHSGIVSRIKIVAQLDIAEQRLPQDGSFTFDFINRKYEIRVSTISTIYGENIVLRILSGTGSLMKMSALGMYQESIQAVLNLFQKSYGIILVTGPTGSGKTTTLYAAMREINLLERNVITVEDPVEYRLSFVKQTQINEKAGYTFAMASRNFMRQDPDVMLLGEIRDQDTAKTAVRASVTGHLVLSTLHTNDAVTSIPRLLDLGVDKHLLSSSLLAILAQRLVRKICPHCCEEYTLDDEELAIFRSAGYASLTTAKRGTGCSKCNETGYFGRVVMCELLVLNDAMRESIFSGVSTVSMFDAAVKNGMVPLKSDGIRKAAEGVTTLAEVLRVAG